jgi:L-phenylalanine/L-methionine N-acetyltransferase
MPELEIRPVAAEDAEAIWRLARQPGVIETTLALPTVRLAERRRRIEELGPDSHMVVAARHGEVVGWADLDVGAGRRRHAAELSVAVGAAHQGKGVGSALIAALLELADSWLGLRRVELHVLAGNERARAVYERHGFTLEGRLRAYAVSGGRLADAWLMARLRPALEPEAQDAAETAPPD